MEQYISKWHWWKMHNGLISDTYLAERTIDQINIVSQTSVICSSSLDSDKRLEATLTTTSITHTQISDWTVSGWVTLRIMFCRRRMCGEKKTVSGFAPTIVILFFNLSHHWIVREHCEARQKTVHPESGLFRNELLNLCSVKQIVAFCKLSWHNQSFLKFYIFTVLRFIY